MSQINPFTTSKLRLNILQQRQHQSLTSHLTDLTDNGQSSSSVFQAPASQQQDKHRLLFPPPSPPLQRGRILQEIANQHPSELQLIYNDNNSAVICVVCTVCEMSIAPRSDRVRDHLKCNRHLAQMILGSQVATKDDSDILPRQKTKIPTQTISRPETSSPPLALIRGEDIEVTVEEIVETSEVPMAIAGTTATSAAPTFASLPSSPTSAHQTQDFPSLTFRVRPQSSDGSRMMHVRWDFFESNIANMFTRFRNLGSFIDCEVFCEGQTLLCHKLVLASCSLFFERILTTSPLLYNSRPIVFLTGMRIQEVTRIVEFMYRGEITVPEDTVRDLLAAAQELEVKGLWAQNRFNGYFPPASQ